MKSGWLKEKIINLYFAINQHWLQETKEQGKQYVPKKEVKEAKYVFNNTGLNLSWHEQRYIQQNK